MSRVRILLISSLTAAAALAATPSLAATPITVTGTVNFVDGQNDDLYGGDNELASSKFTITQSDPTKPALTVTAQGWNATASTAGKYTLSRQYVGQYVGGLGVTTASPTDYNGAYGLHQADNVGASAGTSSIDFVLLTFNQAVNLTSLTRNSYGIGPSTSSLVYDNDFSYGYLAAAPTESSTWSLPGTIWSPTNASACGGASHTSSSNCLNQTQALTNAGYSKYWMVAASFLSNYGDSGTSGGTVDGFKLASINVAWQYTPPSNPATAAPEPATWAQMILGFGLAGAAIRRRRRPVAAA